MKIKCAIDKHSKMMDFINIITSLSKYGDRLIFIARPETVTCTTMKDATKSYVWFDINCSSFFCRYVFEGVDPTSAETDLIFLEINCEYLISALNAARKSANFLEIKLEKKEFPCLAITMILPTGSEDKDKDKTRTNSCQVPVMILPRNVFEDYQLPYGTISFEVRADCPRFSIMKKFINIFKNNRIVKIILRDDNTMTIEANEDTSNHYSIFDKVAVKVYGEEIQYKGPEKGCSVEQKKIAQWIHCINFSSIHLQCMIKDGAYLKLFFRLGDEIMAQFITPAIFSEDDCSDIDEEIPPQQLQDSENET